MSSDSRERVDEIACSFEGDNPRQGHKVRDNPRLKAGSSRERVDVVIVGGGVSGLTAAYKLRNRSIIVLEKDKLPGGAARCKEWDGIKYTLGATNIRMGYEVEINGRKIDFLTPYFDDLKVKWNKIREPTDNFFFGRTLIHNILGEGVKELPYSQHIKENFREAWAYLKKKVDRKDCPIIPIEANSAKILRLDQHSLAEMLSKYGPEVRSVVDIFSRSIFGEISDQVSAFAALCYLRGEFSDQYGAPGGTAQLTERLLSILGDRVKPGCIAAGIQQKSSSALVTYLDENFQPVTVECKAVIYAASKHVAPRIFRGLPRQKLRAIQSLKFDAYFVANIFCKGVVYDDSFAAYFDDAVFTDLVVNDWISGKSVSNGKQVLSLFCPRGTNGREELLSNSGKYWAGQILRDLDRYGLATDRIVRIEICRYGHHFAIPYPGYISNVREIIRRPHRRYFFAKDDTQGVPCLESALWSGMRVAEEVEEFLARNRTSRKARSTSAPRG